MWPSLMKMLWLVFCCFAILVITACEKSATKNVKPKITIPTSEFTLLNKMQGYWQDKQSDEAIIEVVGKKMLWVYQEEVMAEKTIEVYNAFPNVCTGSPKDNGEGFFIAYKDGEGFCYQVIDLKDDVFDYYPLGPVKK